MRVLYLLSLIAVIGCIVSVDMRFRLFLGRSWRDGCLVLGAGVLFFLAWDLAGIGLGIFSRGDSPYLTGIMLAPELPLEEVFFLLLLCELTMVLVLGIEKLRAARRASREDRS